MAYQMPGDLYHLAYQRRLAERRAQPGPLNYLILVPTLRCNLACSYCQVSRVNEDATGFDWSTETLQSVLSFLGTLSNSWIKIEFQGGEPLLRVDLLNIIYDFCEDHFVNAEYVVCTNLQEINDDALAFLSRERVFVSTSLDGDAATHQKNRTENEAQTNHFFENLASVLSLLGPERVSALPTIDPRSPPKPSALLNAFQSYGFKSIYLRPVNLQGFARKRYKDSASAIDHWNNYYAEFIDYLVEYNATADVPMEEFYLSLCLSRILRPGVNGHVDLRSPNWLGTDYLVVDYDGQLFPTDEARMLYRSGIVDLSIGHIRSGLEHDVIANLNWASSNDRHPVCSKCIYQPFCGTDIIDDISRYGRIDHPKNDTWFCQRHMAIFDKIVSLMSSENPKVRKSLEIWAGGRVPALPRMPST